SSTPVLNAFRHQRYFHEYFWYSQQCPLIVLNAFRHQRYFHVWGGDAQPQGLGCSTPFGIKGTFTYQGPARKQKLSEVLNAFRHQRYFHAIARLLHFFHSCAQRLSASKVLSPPAVTV